MSSYLKAAGITLAVGLMFAVNAGAASAKIMEFASANYAATLTGTQTEAHTFKIESGTVQCKTASFTGTLTAQAQTVSVAPTYANCTLGANAATVTLNGCTYTLRAGLEVEAGKSLGGMVIGCGAGKEIVITVPATGCEVKIPATTKEVGFLDFANNVGETEFSVVFDAEFNYSVNGKCGMVAGNYEFGLYKGKSTVKGNNGGVGIL